MTGSPLVGVRVVVTRPRAQAAALCRMLEACGAVPLVFPTIEIVPPVDPAPLDMALGRLADYEWIVFTSVNGVDAVFARLGDTGLPPSLRVAAIGPATAQALAARGAGAAAMPEEHLAERIADVVGEVRGLRFLLPRAARARKELAVLLRDRGATVDDVAAYDTTLGRPTPAEWHALRAGFDAVTFTSSSTVEHFLELVPDASALLADAVVACIGPITEATARARGLAVAVVGTRYTTDGLVAALTRHFSQTEAASS